MRWLLPIILGFALLSPSVILAANPTQLEQEIGEVRRQREALIEEQRKLEAELNQINLEANTLGTAVKSLDTTRKKLEADIRVTRSRINSTELTIDSLKNTMTAKERQISTHKDALAATIQALSRYDLQPLVLDLLSHNRLADLWSDRSQLAGLNIKLEDEIDVLRETNAALNQEKKEKEVVIERQRTLQDQLSGQRSVVAESQKAKERLLEETKNKEAEYQRLLEENLARQKEFEDDLYRLESELRVTLDPSLYPGPRQGVLSWPLDYVYITQEFGDTSFARSGAYNGRGHNGIDMRASQGTAVRATLSGVVEGTGNTDEQRGCYSYGRWILIKHNNGLSTIYAHLSASLVRKGQSVSTGQVIGYSGGTPRTDGAGYSFGPHLHLGLFASQGVSIRQFVTSRGCKQISLPIADLKAYLDPLAYLPRL